MSSVLAFRRNQTDDLSLAVLQSTGVAISRASDEEARQRVRDAEIDDAVVPPVSQCQRQRDFLLVSHSIARACEGCRSNPSEPHVSQVQPRL